MCYFTIPTLVGGGSVCFSILCPGGFCGCRNNRTFTVTKPCVFGSPTKSCLGFVPSSSEAPESGQGSWGNLQKAALARRERQKRHGKTGAGAGASSRGQLSSRGPQRSAAGPAASQPLGLGSLSKGVASSTAIVAAGSLTSLKQTRCIINYNRIKYP